MEQKRKAKRNKMQALHCDHEFMYTYIVAKQWDLIIWSEFRGIHCILHIYDMCFVQISIMWKKKEETQMRACLKSSMTSENDFSFIRRKGKKLQKGEKKKTKNLIDWQRIAFITLTTCHIWYRNKTII